jgi:outer membrane protein TolC
MRRAAGTAILLALFVAGPASADEVSLTYAQALERAAHLAPDIAVARAAETVAVAESGIAGLLPNPSLSAGTSTRTAKLSLGVSVPLLLLGQRGAAVSAGQAEIATTRLDTQMAAADVRALVAHAFVGLWRAQATAFERARAATVSRRLEEAVRGRVELGAAPSVDGLRARAELLRADSEAQQTAQLVGAAASSLARWLALDTSGIRAEGDPEVPESHASLEDLRARLEQSPVLRRERAAAHAADMRAERERALARPVINADFGFDAWDPTLCPGNSPCDNPPVNYRGGLSFEVPILHQRGPYVDRERALAAAARTREAAERAQLIAALTTAYRTCEAWSASVRALADGVVPAADAAAAATEESYELGRAPLLAVLDAEKARIDARLSLLDARTQQADAWIEVEHATGAQ